MKAHHLSLAAGCGLLLAILWPRLDLWLLMMALVGMTYVGITEERPGRWL